MDYTGRVSLTIAVGIILGLIYARRTGWSAGGLVTPGLMAIQAVSFVNFTATLLLATLFAAILRILSKPFLLYGRERIGAALLIAITFRLIFRGNFVADAFWIGWIAPGLIAADIERQGFVMTMSAVISTSLATAFGIWLFFLLSGVMS